MNDNGFQFPTWLTAGRAWLIGSTVAILTLVVITTSYFNGIWNDGVRIESGLNQSYKDNQNYLSASEEGFYESVGVANLKSAKLDKILTDAVKGRYEGHTSAQPGQGQLFSAITEAYPNIDLSVYDHIVEYIQGQRAGYRNMQSKLLSEINAYDIWRRSGLFRHMAVSYWGFPSHDLRACIHADCKYGQEAEDRMNDIVITEGAANAYTTSTTKPFTVPKD